MMCFWGLKVKHQGQRVNKCIFHTIFHSIIKKNDTKAFKLNVGNDLAIS